MDGAVLAGGASWAPESAPSSMETLLVFEQLRRARRRSGHFFMIRVLWLSAVRVIGCIGRWFPRPCACSPCHSARLTRRSLPSTSRDLFGFHCIQTGWTHSTCRPPCRCRGRGERCRNWRRCSLRCRCSVHRCTGRGRSRKRRCKGRGVGFGNGHQCSCPGRRRFRFGIARVRHS